MVIVQQEAMEEKAVGVVVQLVQLMVAQVVLMMENLVVVELLILVQIGQVVMLGSIQVEEVVGVHIMTLLIMEVMVVLVL